MRDENLFLAVQKYRNSTVCKIQVIQNHECNKNAKSEKDVRMEDGDGYDK